MNIYLIYSLYISSIVYFKEVLFINIVNSILY
jgi:hypothetical protein